MANAIYPIYKTAILSASASVSLTVNDATDGPFCHLHDTGADAFSATDDFYDDVVAGIVGATQRITNPTVGSVAAGVFDGDNLTYTAVTGASVEALLIYRHNAGANTTWRLVAFIDTGVTGLPVTPNGGDITVTWNASGIFLISDKNMKENIVEVDHVGVLPVYEFNYNGNPSRQRGFLAQEVEKISSAAVIDFGKFKAVNYNLAVDAALELAA